MKKNLLIALLAAASPLAAQAADNYAGISAGRTDHELSVGNLSVDDKGQGVKLFAGHQFDPMFGIEGGLAFLGEGKVGTLSAKPRALYVAATGNWPLSSQFSLTAKAGVTHNRTEFTYTGGSDNDSANSVMLGFGAVFKINANVSLVAEYENFGKVAKDDDVTLRSSMLSAGVRFNF
ncbi:porin family protein [Massilia glaciei]|nr:porin family protein [Massilia glaciei]